MKNSIKWPIRLASGALVVLTLAGVAIAAGQQGSQADPLVTLSYLTDKATPAILTQVDAKITQREAALKTQLAAVVDGYVKEVEDKLRVAGGSATVTPTGETAAYTVVTLKAGQKLTGNAGCELLLRTGSATCISTAPPGLVDTTGGGTLANGGAFLANHLYLTAADGQGLQAKDAVTLLVRGKYTIAS